MRIVSIFSFGDWNFESDSILKDLRGEDMVKRTCQLHLILECC